MQHETRNLIVGGVEAPAGRFSYAVSLKDDISGHFCGGSLISKSVVLTAAHCVAFDANVTVVIGRYNLTDDTVGDEIEVAEKVLHPNYDMARSEDYDIALIFLARPAPADLGIVQVNADGSVPVAGTDLTYLGWGEVDSDDSTLNVSETLREVDSTVITNAMCSEVAGFVDGTSWRDSYAGIISEVELCTFAIGRDSCQKDSGGPLMIRGKDESEDIQVGVASWGIKCASNVFPGVAARTSSVYNWMKDTVCNKGIGHTPEFECGNNTVKEAGILETPGVPDTPDPTNLFGSHNQTPIEIEHVAPYPDNGFDSHNQTLMEIDISDPANNFEGDALLSVVTNSQATSNVFGILVFAVAIHMMIAL